MTNFLHFFMVISCLASLWTIAGTFRCPEQKTIRPIIGINTHERNDTREIPTLLGCGTQFIRFSYTWSEVEKIKGEHALPPSSFEYMNALQASGLELLCILAYDNKLHNTRTGKIHFGQFVDEPPKWISAYGDYCAWMVRTFGPSGTGQIRHWEIWNEENAGPAEQYVEVLREAARRIHQEDPTAFIVMGGVSRAEISYLTRCMQLGAGEYVDAVSWHPYRENNPPESTFKPTQYGFPESVSCYADEVREIRNMVRKHTPANKKIALWVTEIGWQTNDVNSRTPKNIQVHPYVQAKYLLRSYIQNFALGVDSVFWYRATDSSFFGLTYGGDKFYPNPGYHALSNLAQHFLRKQKMEVLDWKLTSDPMLKDFHAYAFRIDPQNVLLFLWDTTVDAKAMSTQNTLKVKHSITLPAKLATSCIEGIDLISATPFTCQAAIGETGSILKDVIINDTPVLLKLSIAVSKPQ